MKKIILLVALLLSGCVSKSQLEDILVKIDHNNKVILKRLEALENEKKEASSEKTSSKGKSS